MTSDQIVLSAIVSAVFVLLIWFRFLVRPDLLTFPLTVGLLLLVDRLPRHTVPTAILVTALTIVWANLHGSYVLVPLIRPIMVVVGLLIFIGTYSEYVLARVLLTTSENYTLAVGLSLFIQDQYANRWGIFCAGALIASIPVVALFLIFQRYLVAFAIGSSHGSA